MFGRQGLRLESVLYAQREYGGGCSGSIASRQLVRSGRYVGVGVSDTKAGVCLFSSFFESRKWFSNKV